MKRLIWGLLALLTAGSGAIQVSAAELPRLIEKDGRHALLVDGAPYLVLGIQANNSSNYPAALSKVWQMARDMHANTVLIPVAWEQVEPREGQFDFSYLDTLLAEARKQDLRLVLVWFGSWKNHSPNYAPEWVKLDNQRFPRAVDAAGRTLNSLSPVHPASMEADRKAFVAMMTHLKKIDRQRTVIMVQAENEAGLVGSDRDYSPKAEALFQAQVPEALARGLGKGQGTWKDLFGDAAGETFQAWHVARYIEAIASAGQAAYDLPVYVNCWLRDAFDPEPAGRYPSGGPTDNMLDLYKIAAPSVEFAGPDYYQGTHDKFMRVMDQYGRPDNALFIPEIGRQPNYARYFFPALGKQAIGFSPFGLDYSKYKGAFEDAAATEPLLTPESINLFSRNYKLFAPLSRVWAKISFEKPVWGVAEPEGKHEQHLALGSRWRATVSYGRAEYGDAPPKGNPEPSGGLVIAQLAADEYLVTGYDARIDFLPASDPKAQPYDPARKGYYYARVEEGHFDASGNWIMERVWNGDQTDWGLNFKSGQQVLRVKLANPAM